MGIGIFTVPHKNGHEPPFIPLSILTCLLWIWCGRATKPAFSTPLRIVLKESLPKVRTHQTVVIVSIAYERGD